MLGCDSTQVQVQRARDSEFTTYAGELRRLAKRILSFFCWLSAGRSTSGLSIRSVTIGEERGSPWETISSRTIGHSFRRLNT